MLGLIWDRNQLQYQGNYSIEYISGIGNQILTVDLSKHKKYRNNVLKNKQGIAERQSIRIRGRVISKCQYQLLKSLQETDEQFLRIIDS